MEKQQGRCAGIIFSVIEATAWITSGIVIIMMLLIVYDVFMRDLFGGASLWISDFVSSYVIIYMTLLPGAWVLLRGEHVSVDVFVSFLGSRKRRHLDRVTTVLGLIYSIVLTWQGAIFTWREFTQGTAFPVGAWLPIWPSVVVIFLGGIFLCIGYIMKIAGFKPATSEGERVE